MLDTQPTTRNPLPAAGVCPEVFAHGGRAIRSHRRPTGPRAPAARFPSLLTEATAALWDPIRLFLAGARGRRTTGLPESERVPEGRGWSAAEPGSSIAVSSKGVGMRPVKGRKAGDVLADASEGREGRRRTSTKARQRDRAAAGNQVRYVYMAGQDAPLLETDRRLFWGPLRTDSASRLSFDSCRRRASVPGRLSALRRIPASGWAPPPILGLKPSECRPVSGVGRGRERS